MNKQAKRDLVKLIIFGGFAVLVTVSVIATLLDLKLGQPETSYHAVFSNATGLESGDVVRIAGVEVGKVQGVSLTKDNQAKVDFQVASSQHLTTTTKAGIEFENLLGQRYLQISPGSPGGVPLHGGATIPLSNTTPGLDLTTVFTGFQPLLTALNPQQVNELTGSIVAVLQGESGAVGNLINQTATLTSNLAGKQVLIDQVLDNLTPLLDSVNHDDTQVQQLIDGLDNLAHGLAGERQQIGDAVTNLSNLAGKTTQLFNQIQPGFDNDLTGLRGATNSLLANQGPLDTALQGLPTLLNSLDKASGQGSYLAVYICDLDLNVSGPISVKLSPGVPQSPGLPVPTGVVGDPTTHTQVCQP